MKLTPIKLKIINSQWYKDLCEKIGDVPEFQQILAGRLDIDKRYLSLALNGKITFQKIQEKIANEIGISVGELFGDDAWFRLAAQRLKERQLACTG